MKKRMSWCLACMLVLTLLAGCRQQSTSNTAVSPVPTMPDNAADMPVGRGGSLKLSVNPEIRVDYDENGMVTEIVAENADGEMVVAAAGDLIGTDTSAAVDTLIRQIHDQGYFVNEVDDEKRFVMLQFLSDASADFSDAVTEDVTKTVLSFGDDTAVVTIDADDYDPQYTSDYITIDKAKEIALSVMGVAVENVTFEEREFDFDDGVAVFELEFVVGDVEYDVDVDAVSGTVIRTKQKTVGEDDDDVVPDAAYISYDQAKAATVAYFGVDETAVVFDDDAGLDREDGLVIYEMELTIDGVEYDVDVNALTGDIVGHDVEDEADDDTDDDDTDDEDADDEDDQPIAEEASYVGVETAKEIVLGDLGIGADAAVFADADLDREDGVVVYELELETSGVEYEYTVDAVSGEILRSEQDTDD